MKNTYTLKPHLCRFSKFYKKDSAEVPSALFEVKSEAPDLSDFPLPLPSRKSDYCCFAEAADGAMWYGASNGLTRYDSKAERKADAVMYFAADRDLPDNSVKALYADEKGMWVLTENGVTLIELRMISAREKADILLEETTKYVDRRGMITQKHLAVPGDVTSAVPYGHSDNDGCFTASFTMGELYRYAVLKREKGADHPETIKAKAVATRSAEAVLLLTYIHGRGNGFVARTYLCADEPLPDDGLFFRKTGGKATCLKTSFSEKKGISGLEIDASAPIPDRLAHLYKDLGYTDDDIVYKADTSSDEISTHYLFMLVAHEILGEDDPELDAIIKETVVRITDFIIDNGYQLLDYSDEPTTWAKWNTEYFETPFGWVDACLNSAEMLMYLKVAMAIAGEEERWQKSYEELIEKGYADLPMKHFDRLYQSCLSMDCAFEEEIMYGDHMLATVSLFGLCTLEKDEELLAKYRKAYKTWRTSIAREHNPGYDFPYAVACPDEELDMDTIATWFYRTNASRLAAGVSLVGRKDVAVIRHSEEYKEVASVLPPDECFISKYDRNTLEYKNEDSGGLNVVESCYVYSYAYWMGRYYGFIKDEGENING